MKRLFQQHADAIINTKIMELYGIVVSAKRDISNPDKMTAYAIKQALLHAIRAKYSNASNETTDQFVCVVIDSIMHLDPIIAFSLTGDKASLRIWEDIIDTMRKKITWRYAGSCMSNEKLYEIIVENMLKDLENRFF